VAAETIPRVEERRKEAVKRETDCRKGWSEQGAVEKGKQQEEDGKERGNTEGGRKGRQLKQQRPVLRKGHI